MSVAHKDGQGVCYLLHFDRPFKHARLRHYLGFTTDLERRLDDHAHGHGSTLMAYVSAVGIGFEVVRTWPGGRDLERRLKNWHNSPKLCPVCRGSVGGPAGS